MATRKKPEARPPLATGLPDEGRARAVIDSVLPCVDGGRFAAKAIAGQPFEVEAHAFTDGHDAVRVMLRWQAEGTDKPFETEMVLRYNDEWLARFVPPSPGRYAYGAVAWVDHFRSWRQELMRRTEPDDIRIAARTGAELIDHAAARATGDDRQLLQRWSSALKKPVPSDADIEVLKALALDEAYAQLADRYPDRSLAVSSPMLPLTADRVRAGFGAWYELFPRSTAQEEGRHGTFADAERLLPRVAQMGFDVVYFPPIHPIGREKRKGPNNSLVAGPGDVGSPWAIGASEGGHKSILPALGTPEDFRHLVQTARGLGLEVALDIALQCAPDHPYVKEHPQWFRWRPDGTVQYAENPPKKYQDIYPFNFETEDWRALWAELKSIFDHWIAQGVDIFRVDNPHTKSFAFWAWCIGELKREHPQVLFLSEAFTRPKVMHRLAKLGFSQSYTYFTWRRTREELTAYFTELSQGPGAAYFRPNAWPNTPDILAEPLHGAGRPAFAMRLMLAATLCANYGVYGPAYELMDSTPRSPGSEEYLDSEKYQLRHWDLAHGESLQPLMTRLNTVRRENPALQSNAGLCFFPTDNEQLIAYGKRSPDGENAIVCVVNLDLRFRQSGWIELDTAWLGLEPGEPYAMDDLVGGQSFAWQGGRNFVILDPAQAPGHVMRLRRRKEGPA